MNYIGSKLKLCQKFLPNTIKSVCGEDLSQKHFVISLQEQELLAELLKLL